MTNHVKIKGIDCFGEMNEDQNIEVKCNDEFDDGVYPDGFKNWTEAVNHLLKSWDGEIVELETI